MRRTLLPIAAAIVAVVTPARAGIQVGEVSSARADTLPTLRRAVEDEVAHLVVKRDAIVSVALVRLETSRGVGGDTVTCVVSATLRTRSGNVFAILEGRARAESNQPVTVEMSAMRTAVHSAISRIPEALK